MVLHGVLGKEHPVRQLMSSATGGSSVVHRLSGAEGTRTLTPTLPAG